MSSKALSLIAGDSAAISITSRKSGNACLAPDIIANFKIL